MRLGFRNKPMFYHHLVEQIPDALIQKWLSASIFWARVAVGYTDESMAGWTFALGLDDE